MSRHPSSFLLTASLIGGLLLAPLAGAQQEIASSPIAPDGQPAYVVLPLIDAYGGVTVGTEREQAPGEQTRYFLTAYRDGQRTRLPIAPRGVPFDVDLGPSGDGGIVAAYSRCDREPSDSATPSRVFTLPQPRHTLGRGCDLYRFDFATGREAKIPGASTDRASEVLPSIWKDRVAFTRVFGQRFDDRGSYPYLYTRPLTGGASKREPGGSRGTNGLPGPTSLDLYGGRLSFVWNYSTGEARSGDVAGVSEVRLNTVGGGHRLLSQARFENLEYASYVTPQGADGCIYYGFQRVRSEASDPRRASPRCCCATTSRPASELQLARPVSCCPAPLTETPSCSASTTTSEATAPADASCATPQRASADPRPGSVPSPAPTTDAPVIAARMITLGVSAGRQSRGRTTKHRLKNVKLNGLRGADVHRTLARSRLPACDEDEAAGAFANTVDRDVQDRPVVCDVGKANGLLFGRRSGRRDALCSARDLSGDDPSSGVRRFDGHDQDAAIDAGLVEIASELLGTGSNIGDTQLQRTGIACDRKRVGRPIGAGEDDGERDGGEGGRRRGGGRTNAPAARLGQLG